MDQCSEPELAVSFASNVVYYLELAFTSWFNKSTSHIKER